MHEIKPQNGSPEFLNLLLQKAENSRKLLDDVHKIPDLGTSDPEPVLIPHSTKRKKIVAVATGLIAIPTAIMVLVNPAGGSNGVTTESTVAATSAPATSQVPRPSTTVTANTIKMLTIPSTSLESDPTTTSSTSTTTSTTQPLPVETSIVATTASLETIPADTDPPQQVNDGTWSRNTCVKLEGTPTQAPNDGSGFFKFEKAHHPNLSQDDLDHLWASKLPDDFRIRQITASEPDHPVYECDPSDAVIQRYLGN